MDSWIANSPSSQSRDREGIVSLEAAPTLDVDIHQCSVASLFGL